MCRNFPAGLYSVLFFLLLCISGCQLAHFAGGGHSSHRPPKNIICDKQWAITIGVSITMPDPKEKYGKLAERWKDVTVHIRDSSDSNFLTVPMEIESINIETGELHFKASMKPIPCNSGVEYIEYYIDFMFDHNYSRSKLYGVPVSKD